MLEERDRLKRHGLVVKGFVSVRRTPVAAAIEWARELECLGALEKMLTRELKLKTRDVKRLKETAEKLIEKAEEAQA